MNEATNIPELANPLANPRGAAHVYNTDHINTDDIIPARYMVMDTDEQLAPHAMEGIDANFSSRVQQGDILVAGEDFGCGSSREHAIFALRGAGIQCVIAKTFARIFFRNAINNGIIVIESDACEKIQMGDTLEVDLDSGVIRNATRNEEYTFVPLAPFAKEMISKGGLMNTIKEKLAKQGMHTASSSSMSAQSIAPKEEQQSLRVAVLPGDGIGPEVMDEAIKCMDSIAKRFNLHFEITQADVGGCAIDTRGLALPPATINACENAQAILFGAIGGPKWESLPPEQQPERAALLPLRKHFGLFANLRPVKLFGPLVDASTLKPEVLEGMNLLVVRELTGGIYFGEPKELIETADGYEAKDTMVYTDKEIRRIAHVAFKSAKTRGNRVTSIDKANVLESSVLWRRTVESVAKEYPDVELSHMYVDAAAMQLIRNPSQFDVILCGNLFGDIISDEASMLTGSIGMLPSASLRDDGFGLYEPVHGSAPDIVGEQKANPIAMILSVAMMMRHTFKRDDAASAIEDAIKTILDKGIRSDDIMQDGCLLATTSQIGDAICAELNAIEVTVTN